MSQSNVNQTHIYRCESLSEIINNLDCLKSDFFLLVVDAEVANLYNDFINQVQEKLQSKGHTVVLWKAPVGEDCKTVEAYEKAIEFFLARGTHRNAHLIALGGGALSDMAGLVAATLLRGISWSIIPTTLLSQVDASIGGKVAVNSTSGKNLIGAFHRPENVFICSDFLKTLSEEERLSGKGEVLKYCYLDKELFSQLNFENKNDRDQMIHACAQFKLNLTDEDFKEKGQRKILNLGHTFGHALEKIYPLSHGKAVFWGMIVKFLLFDRGDLIDEMKGFCDQVKFHPGESPWLHKTFPLDEILSYVERDKKKLNQSSIEIILIKSVGHPEIKSFELDELKTLLNSKKELIRQYVFD